MTLSVILFLIGVLGFTLNRRNVLLLIVSIEIILLASTLIILISSIQFNDTEGQAFGVYVISIAGAESAIALGVLVSYYRLRGTISFENK